MKVLLASNSFKECATASEVNDAIEQGLLLFKTLFVSPDEIIEIEKIEICDGGTGFASILANANGGTIIKCASLDPLGREIEASYGLSADQTMAYVEVAETCGLARLSKAEQNPYYTTSIGFGIQIVNLIDTFQPKKIFVGCGDTAINDFGLGFLFALGVKFLDADKNEIDYTRPEDFLRVEELNFSQSKYIDFIKKNCELIVCCNLSSVIGGLESNTRIYSKQKGASEDEIVRLEEIRDKFVKIVKRYTGKFISLTPGTGAAGGLGASLFSFCEAKLCYSFEIIFPLISIEEKVKWADLVITGEGLLDNSSLKGKAPISIALLAKKFGKKVALISGAIRTNCTNIAIRGGVDYVETLTSESLNLTYYIINAKVLLRDAGFRLMKKIY